MTHEEAVVAVKRGESVTNEHSLFEAEKPNQHCVHQWRTLFCDSETDVVECGRCGKQGVCACDFNEEFA